MFFFIYYLVWFACRVSIWIDNGRLNGERCGYGVPHRIL
nr:MAG TPA: hypothetical protein [Caudoviricetes sp.]